tara:strand:+ start:233 stop:457 length:225 start_codon:yes stop_codon:yes gene_type:complete
MTNIIKNWDFISVHIWLIMSSYGIIFAVLSFVEDLEGLAIKNEYPWIKGVLSIFLGLIFYLAIGLPHLNGARKR